MFAPILLVLSGCQTKGNVERFLRHPEFKAAAQFAPNFTREVLHTLAECEKKGN